MKNHYNDPFVLKRPIFERTRLVDHQNQFYQDIATSEALNLARSNNMDLVCFSKGDRRESPFCKIINYGKWKYENDKRKKQQESEHKKITKEVRFSPVIEDHDVEHKIKQAVEFLEKGNEVLFSMRLKGRQRKFFSDAEERMNEIVAMCGEHGSEIARKKTSNTITVRVAKAHK